MEYRPLTEQQYYERIRTVVVGAEGLHPHAQDVRDGMATIGYGYTFNRENNVAIWREAGITLNNEQRQALARIDAAGRNDRTRLGLAFDRVLNAEESERLLRASISEYEAPADALDMPLSEERVALVSLAYNRGVAPLLGNPARQIPEHPVMDAIRSGDRAEAWFQMRYNCWGSTDPSLEGGLRKRRFAEAEVFGLYDDAANVTLDEARSVHRMHQLHRDEIDRVERAFGMPLDGEPTSRNRIAEATRDYPALVRQYGPVQTLASALQPAQDVMLAEQRGQHADLADVLPVAPGTGHVHHDPGRDLRTAEEVRQLVGTMQHQVRPPRQRTIEAVGREQGNATHDIVSTMHGATLDARQVQNGIEQSRNDLLIGEAGDDILRGGLGHDVMLGGAGHDRYDVDAGDVVKDADGRGALSWGGRALDGGTLDPATGRYRSADSALTYSLDGTRLTIADAQGQTVRVEGFRNGALGIHLTTSRERTSAEPTPTDPRNPAHPDHALYRQAERAVTALDAGLGHKRDDASERMIASGVLLAKSNGLQRIDQMVFSRQTTELAAGHNVFVVEGAPGNLASRRAHMTTHAALRTPVEQVYAQLEAFDRQQDTMGRVQLAQQEERIVAVARTHRI